MEKEKVMTDKQIHRQTHRISSCRLDPFCRRGRVKIRLLFKAIVSIYFLNKWSSCDLLHLAGLKRCQAAVECFLLLYFSVNWKCSLPSFGMARVRNCFKSGKNPLHSKWFMINQLKISFCEMTNPLQFLCTDLDHCVAGRYQTQLCTENLWPRNHRYCYIVENSWQLDPVGSTVRYEMMKLCTGSEWGHYEAVAVGDWTLNCFLGCIHDPPSKFSAFL